MMNRFNVIILAYAQNKGRIDELPGSTFTSLIYAFYLGAGCKASKSMQATSLHLSIGP